MDKSPVLQYTEQYNSSNNNRGKTGNRNRIFKIHNTSLLRERPPNWSQSPADRESELHCLQSPSHSQLLLQDRNGRLKKTTLMVYDQLVNKSKLSKDYPLTNTRNYNQDQQLQVEQEIDPRQTVYQVDKKTHSIPLMHIVIGDAQNTSVISDADNYNERWQTCGIDNLPLHTDSTDTSNVVEESTNHPTDTGCQLIGRGILPHVNDVEEPMFVNAKQYNRILKRRVARAKLLPRINQDRRKYLHNSRHHHAISRKRGPGGQFKKLPLDLSQENKDDNHTRIAKDLLEKFLEECTHAEMAVDLTVENNEHFQTKNEVSSGNITQNKMDPDNTKDDPTQKEMIQDGNNYTNDLKRKVGPENPESEDEESPYPLFLDIDTDSNNIVTSCAKN